LFSFYLRVFLLGISGIQVPFVAQRHSYRHTEELSTWTLSQVLDQSASAEHRRSINVIESDKASFQVGFVMTFMAMLGPDLTKRSIKIWISH
jgi:hypothetical protein